MKRTPDDRNPIFGHSLLPPTILFSRLPHCYHMIVDIINSEVPFLFGCCHLGLTVVITSRMKDIIMEVIFEVLPIKI